jgi:ATP adenylyltransferase
LKRLFSPWRSAYIETFKSRKKTKGCLFCRVAKSKDDNKNLVVWRGKHAFVLMNLYPYNSGHLLVVPYKHTKGMNQLSAQESAEVMRVSGHCMKALGKISKPHGFNFGANLGRVAGAGIEGHVHFHVVPRWNGDTNFMPVLSDTKVISEEMKKTWKELKNWLSKAQH